MILQRVQIAALKAKYKEFGIWFIKYLGYENIKLDKFEMHIHVYMPSNRRADVDNICGGTGKILNDAFTATGFIIDDSYDHLTKLTMTCGADKNNPRTEITITVIE